MYTSLLHQLPFRPRKVTRPSAPSAFACRVVPQLEILEERVLLRTWLVTTYGDRADVQGTLRWAISQAQAGDTVAFNFRGGKGGVIDLSIKSPLEIKVPITIDGTTQDSQSSVPPIIIRGPVDPFGEENVKCLIITGGGCTIKGLQITQFDTGINILNKGKNKIDFCWIGYTKGGAFTANVGNKYGIIIRSSDNIIGLSNSSERCIVSGNSTVGISIINSGDNPGVRNNQIYGCYIGLDPNGNRAPIPNGIGVYIGNVSKVYDPNKNGSNHVVGCAIAGSRFQGVWIVSSQGNEVSGNIIGTEIPADGKKTIAAGNGGDGILLTFKAPMQEGANVNPVALGPCSNNDITNNVIAANGGDGVGIEGDRENQSRINKVEGNIIGTDRGQVATDLGNKGHGISIVGSDSNSISDKPPQKNAIVNNGGWGVYLVRANMTDVSNLLVGATEKSPAVNVTALDQVMANKRGGIYLEDGLRCEITSVRVYYTKGTVGIERKKDYSSTKLRGNKQIPANAGGGGGGGMGGLGGGGTTAGILVLDAAGGTIESDVNNADLDEPSVIISGAVLSPIQLVGSNQIGNYQQTGEWVVEDGTGSVLNAAGYFIDGGITTISNGAIVSAGGLATVTTTGQLTIANAQVNAVWPIRNSRSFFSRNWFTKSRPLSVAPAGPAYPELRQTASLKHDHSGSAPFAAPKGANELPPGRLRPPTVG